MDHDCDNGKEFQYFVFGLVILGIFGKQP